MKKAFSFLFVFLLLVALIFSCKHDIPVSPDPGGGPGPGGTQPCSPDTAYFKNKVLPLIVQSCAQSNCHDAVTHKEGVELTSYEKIMTTGEVRPGRPDNSKLYEVIEDNEMPYPGPPGNYQPLTSAQKNLIYTWIMQGALNNACNDCDTSFYTYTSAISQIVQNHCITCHSGPNVSVSGGGILLDSYANVKAQGENGKLYPAVSHTGPILMPRGGNKLSDCQITQIKKWMDNNYPN